MPDDFWPAAALWTARSLLAGGVALLLAWVALRWVRDPARRRRVVAWSVRAAVVACGLALLPAWLSVPAPTWAQPEDARAKPQPAVQDAQKFVPEEPEEFLWVPVEGGVDLPAEPPAEPAGEADPVAAEPPAPPEPAPDRLAAVAPVVLIPYWACVGVLALRQILGLIGLARLRRAAAPAPDDVQLRAAQLAVGGRFPRVLVTDRLATPVCFGVFRPTILLPRALVKSATPDQLRWALAHELHHLRQGDPAVGAWVGVARAIFFPLPWFWAVRRELGLAQEHLADAAAAGTQGADYAAFLVELSSRPGVPRSVRAVPSLAGVRAGQSDLYRRVTMLLEPKTNLKSRWGRAWSAVALTGAVSAAVVLSGVRLTADEPKKGDKKPDDVRKTEAKPVEVEVRLFEAKVAADTAEVEKAIVAAAQKGDVETVRKLVAKLKAAAPPAPPVPPLPPAPPVVVKALPPGGDGLIRVKVALDDETQKLEKAVEKLKQAMEEVKDQPEARAALEKSIQAYRERIAEARKKGELKAAELAKEHGDLAKLHQQQGQQFKLWAQAANPKAAMDQVQASVAEMMKLYEKQLAGLANDPKAAEALKESMKAYKASMDQLAKQLGGGTGQFQFQGLPPVAVPLGVRDGVAADKLYAVRKAPASGRLGVAIEPVPAVVAEQLDLPPGKGVIVLSVVPDSPAAKAGLKGNDILLEVSGRVVTVEDLPKVVTDLKPEQGFDVLLVRKGKKETVKGVTLPAAKAEPKKGGAKSSSLSVSVTDGRFEITAKEDALTYALAGAVGETEGVVVTITDAGKAATYKGLKSVPADHREKVEKLLKSVSGK